MESIDLKKTYRPLYTAREEPARIDVPELPFLMIDGVGDPDGQGYKAAVSALYGVAYAIRFGLKHAGILEYSVPPLQGLWSGDYGDRDRWSWTMLLQQPDAVTPEWFAEGIAKAAAKKPDLPVDRVRLERFREGTSVQILHVGPFSTEPVTIERLFAYAGQEGLTGRGRHHEIYLSNPGRVAPEKMKTIIRHPVKAL